MSHKLRCKHIQTAIADLEAGYQGGQGTWTPWHPFSAVKLRDRNKLYYKYHPMRELHRDDLGRFQGQRV